MARAKRFPGDPTPAQRRENEFYVLEAVIHRYSWGNFVTSQPLRGPRSLLVLAEAALRDGVSLYRAAYREFRKEYPHHMAHGFARAIAKPGEAHTAFAEWWASHPDAPAVVAAREHAEFMASRKTSELHRTKV